MFSYEKILQKSPKINTITYLFTYTMTQKATEILNYNNTEMINEILI